MRRIRVNYHNHTVFSDGSYLPGVIAEEALRTGMDAIGITDHCFSGGKLGPNNPSQVKRYIEAVKDVRDTYEGRIRVATGMEVIFGPNMANRGIPREICSRLDFILFEYVGLYRGFGLDELVSIRKQFDCRIGLAHTDVDVAFESVGRERLVDILEGADIFIELCPSLRNMRVMVDPADGKTIHTAPPYRCSPGFYRLLKGRDIGLTIGTDTHEDISDVCNIGDAVDFIDQIGLWENVIEI
ncbi:MAG: PHP domain-containing protein [Candidatus Tritonobacter lacicola]|nr:PHP domain-containing protein [Candidatus Tritonobacter lacicola]